MNMNFLKLEFVVISLLLLSLVSVLVLPVYPRENQDKKETAKAADLVVTKAQSPIKIDGVLDEKEWEGVIKVNFPYEWAPGENIPALVDTECFITYNRTTLYIGFRCFDPEPKKIRAHLMNRDTMGTFLMDDHVLIMLDPFKDERRAFELRINPLGVQADAIYSEVEGYEDFSWDAIWYSAGKITDFGYSVEVGIPFNQLRFPKTKEKQTWGVYLARAYPRTITHRLGPHKRNRNWDCILCEVLNIGGFEGMSPGKNLEFDPTLTVNRTDQRDDFPEGEMREGKLNVEPGISGRWGITSNLVLNSTINPDFSHVEADVAQLEVNTRFALRYPEKRPFFLEGMDLFQTPLEVIFSRTVFNPLWGVKLSGKMGRNAIAFLSAQDRYNNLLFPANQESMSTSVKEDVFGGVLRYRRDIGKGSNLGLLYTGRMSDGYYNHVGGVDGFLRLSKTKSINFQFLRSQTNYPDGIASNFGQKADAFGGNALIFNFRHFGRSFWCGFEYENLSPDFRADYGFIPRVGLRRLMGFAQPRIWGGGDKWFYRIQFELYGEKITDHNGNLTDQTLEVSATYRGLLQSLVHSAFSFKKEFYDGVTYDINQFQGTFEMRPISGLKYYIIGKFGDSVDYTNSRLARSFFLNPGFEWTIGRHFNISLNHILERLSLEGEKIYNATLFQTKLIYNFSTRTFIRAIVQYTDIDRNVDLYNFPIAPETKTLFTQFLFSYKLNPQTVLFLGYSDNHLGNYGFDITRKDRTFFLKVGYALVL